MTPYSPTGDIYQSGADPRFNSFTDPNPMAYGGNQQNGPWGINPALITPAYTASYRPLYNGNQGNPFGGPRPGFGQSLNQVFNPFAGGGQNFGGNSYQQQSPYYDTLGMNPVDRTASIMQKYAIPGLASWAAYRYLTKPFGDMGARIGGGAVTGMLGGSFSAGTTATIGSMGAGLGRLAAGGFLPMAAAQTVSWGLDKTIFDPYTAQRQTSNDLRRNFAGITFGNGEGNHITGKGFSRQSSADFAGRISHMGAIDSTFNQSEMSNLTDLASRAGLMDNVSGSKQMADRMKSIVSQVKMVMTVGNTSDFKETMEILSKLQTAGVASKDVTSTLSKLGNAASVSGVSLQKMMATVGAAGGYAYGSNGLTQSSGILAAANAYGSFTQAQRSGLISTGLLARMGGVEGATQSAVGAQLGFAQSPYAQMGAYNKFTTGSSAAGSSLETVSRFNAGMLKGGNIASNIGAYNYEAAHMASQQSDEEGHAGQWRQLMQWGKESNLLRNGKLSGGAANLLLTSRLGLTQDQAQAFIEQQISDQDPDSIKGTIASRKAAYKERRLKSDEQSGLVYGAATAAVSTVAGWGRSAQDWGAGMVSGGLKTVGREVDSLEKTMFGIAHGSTSDYSMGLDSDSTKSISTDFDAAGKGIEGDSWSRSVIDRMQLTKVSIGEIKDAIESLSNDKDMVALVGKRDRIGISKKVEELAENDNNYKAFRDESARNELVDALMKRAIDDKTGSISNDKTGLADQVAAKDLTKMVSDVMKAGGKVTQATVDRYNKDTKGHYSMAEVKAGLNTLAGKMAGYDTNKMRGVEIKGFDNQFMESAKNAIDAAGTNKANKESAAGVDARGDFSDLAMLKKCTEDGGPALNVRIIDAPAVRKGYHMSAGSLGPGKHEVKDNNDGK